MDWIGWEGKKVFIRTKSGKVYSGIIIEVEGIAPLVFIHIIDKFEKKVCLVYSEILEIKEEA